MFTWCGELNQDRIAASLHAPSAQDPLRWAWPPHLIRDISKEQRLTAKQWLDPPEAKEEGQQNAGLKLQPELVCIQVLIEAEEFGSWLAELKLQASFMERLKKSSVFMSGRSKRHYDVAEWG